MTDDTQYTQIALTKPVDLDKLAGAHLDAADQKRNSFVFDANSLTERVRQMFTHLDGLEKERAMKAVLCGIYLAEIKAKTPHGEFSGWLASNFPSSVRKGQYYMALAAKFSRSSKLLLPELIAANQISLALEAPDATGEALMAKLDKFVGTSGLTDLLRKHGIVKQGGNQRPALPAPATPEAAAAQERQNEEQAEARMFASVMDTITKAEQHLLAELTWSMLTPDSAELLENKLKSVLASYHERLLRARHERSR